MALRSTSGATPRARSTCAVWANACTPASVRPAPWTVTRFPAELRDRGFQRLLNREPVRLALPPYQPGSVIFDRQLVAGHGSTVPGRYREAAQESARIERRAARPLQPQKAKDALAAGDRKPVVEHGARHCLPPDPADRSRHTPVSARRSSRKKRRAKDQSPNPALQLDRSQPPVEPAFLAANFRGVGHPILRLRTRNEPALREHPRARPASSGRRALPALPRGWRRRVAADRHLLLQQDRPGIKPLLHLHDRDPGRSVAGQQCPLDRCRAAPARQQRGVHIEAAETWHRQDLGGQDQAIGSDDGRVDAQLDERTCCSSVRRRVSG